MKSIYFGLVPTASGTKCCLDILRLFGQKSNLTDEHPERYAIHLYPTVQLVVPTWYILQRSLSNRQELGAEKSETIHVHPQNEKAASLNPLFSSIFFLQPSSKSFAVVIVSSSLAKSTTPLQKRSIFVCVPLLLV